MIMSSRSFQRKRLIQIIIGVIIISQYAIAIDIGKFKMYKQWDIEYNERLKNSEDENTIQIQNDGATNDDIEEETNSKHINFPKVIYTYKDISSILNGKVSTITEKQKIFEGLNTMIEEEQEFKNVLENIKVKQNDLRLKSISYQEDIYLNLEKSEIKTIKKIYKLSKHLDELKVQAQTSSSSQPQIKERIFDLDAYNTTTLNILQQINIDLKSNLERISENIQQQKEQQVSSKKELRIIQSDLKSMLSLFEDSSKIQSLNNAQKIFSDSLKKSFKKTQR